MVYHACIDGSLLTHASKLVVTQSLAKKNVNNNIHLWSLKKDILKWIRDILDPWCALEGVCIACASKSVLWIQTLLLFLPASASAVCVCNASAQNVTHLCFSSFERWSKYSWLKTDGIDWRSAVLWMFCALVCSRVTESCEWICAVVNTSDFSSYCRCLCFWRIFWERSARPSTGLYSVWTQHLPKEKLWRYQTSL